MKRVASITPERMILTSFNPAFPPLVVLREESSLLGTVIARFSRDVHAT